jgi:uncharacterized secreted protein with C-terminal beta-propeller domain
MIEDALRIAKIHLERLQKAREEMEIKNIDTMDIQDFENIKLVDAFVFRFMKLQDFIGEKLFKVFLIKTGDFKDNMSLVDILDKLEKLEIIDSTEKWMKVRKLRNKIAHEYPDEQEQVIEDIKEALKKVDYLAQIYKNIQSFLVERNLL